MEDAVSRPCPPTEDVCAEKMQYCYSSTESQRSTLPERGESGQYEDTRRSLTLQPTAFPEVESLLEGLRKRLRMPAAWAVKDGIQPELAAVDKGKAVKREEMPHPADGGQSGEAVSPGLSDGPGGRRLLKKARCDAVRPDGAESEGRGSSIAGSAS